MNSNDDRTQDDRFAASTRADDSDAEVMSAYDQIDGQAAFVIAALDDPYAWIAVPDGAELDVEEWD